MEAGEELRKLRESTGMNRKDFCEYFGIPYMTETDWELGNRRVPQYLLRLMEYKIQMEKLKEATEMLFICYPRCSTCQKAKKWLDEHNVKYTERHIAEENPSYDELKEWHVKSGLPLKKFFNTSGLLYKEMSLKDKLPAMSEEEQLRLLASNGMLVKRPLVVAGDTVLVGFKEAQWAETLTH